MENNRLSKLLSFLEASPKDSFLIFAVAKEYETSERLDLALKYYTILKENDPEYIGLYYHLADLYARIQEETLALEVYKEGIALAKKKGDYHALSELNNAKTNLEIMRGN